MQCLKMVLNTFKYTRSITKSIYAANVRLSNQGQSIFNRYLSQINRIRENSSNRYQWNNTSRTTAFVASGSFLFDLFKPKEERERDDVEELKMTIKRSILLIQKQEFPKAEQMLHIALRQAQTLQHYDGITYIYDVMANLAYDLNDFEKAETLFKFVLSRLLAKKVPEDDLSIIHISLKIADIYEKRGDIKKAETGYKFCLEHLQKHLANDSENEDVLQLLGLNLEKYATMLFTTSQYTNALNYFTQAYDISVKINGEANEQSVILLNDLGSVSHMLQKYDQAIEYLSKAAELGKRLPDMVDLGSIYVNLGNALIAKGLYKEAEKRCSEGERIAKARDDKDSVNEAKKCLKQIKDLTS